MADHITNFTYFLTFSCQVCRPLVAVWLQTMAGYYQQLLRLPSPASHYQLLQWSRNLLSWRQLSSSWQCLSSAPMLWRMFHLLMTSQKRAQQAALRQDLFFHLNIHNINLFLTTWNITALLFIYFINHSIYPLQSAVNCSQSRCDC